MAHSLARPLGQVHPDSNRDLFSFMFLIFGIVLLATAGQLLRHREQDPSVEDNKLVALVQRALPLSNTYDRGRVITPLLQFAHEHNDAVPQIYTAASLGV